MKSSLRILAVGVVSALATSMAALPSAAAPTTWAYMGVAGGTQVQALGTTISSDLTAQSAVFGVQPNSATNKVAGLDVSPLATVGAVNTDATATAAGDGYKVVAHSRTAKISILNGLITADAVDTTSTAVNSSTGGPAPVTTSTFLNLVIAGKSYPVNVAANTGVTIPGVATVAINWSQSITSGDIVATQGAGLLVTLLAPDHGVPAGAVIQLGPTFAEVQPQAPDPNSPSLGGSAYAAYVFTHAGDAIKAATGHLGESSMQLAGTNGQTFTNTTADVRALGILNIRGVESSSNGKTTPTKANATEKTKLTGLSLFPTLFGGLISATALESDCNVVMDGSSFTTTSDFTFLDLRIAGQNISPNVAPNTTIHVAGIGNVTINERSTITTGGVHQVQQMALHVVLDTATYGLPVGAEIQIGVCRAAVYR